MNALLVLYQGIALIAWLLVFFTAAAILLDFGTVRCNLRGHVTWVATLLLALGAGYHLYLIPGVQSAWQLPLPVGAAAICVLRAPGPWWGWLKSGETYHRRGHDRRVMRGTR